MKIITTNLKKKLFWKETEVKKRTVEDSMHVVNVYSQRKGQVMRGFGGAFTEASAHTYAGLNESEKKKVMEDYFSARGLSYCMGRIPVHSCDFGLESYTYLNEEDATLESFSIEHDKKEILPMLHDAMLFAKTEMEFVASPWSPPSFMKSNGKMCNGGTLLPEHAAHWTEYLIRFLTAYKKEGIKISFLTVQNEPEATQIWESCLYTAQQEAEFVSAHLGPALQQNGHTNCKILIWDHNKESVVDRVEASMDIEKARPYIHGAAVHWYTGDHFEALELVKQEYPQLELFFTEGCVEYSRFSKENALMQAEMYAHDILGNLNAGISVWLDWNLLLDEQGGPNHVGNYCAAPMMCTKGNVAVQKQLSYYYIGHFSRYIIPGSVRIATTRYTDKIEVTGFVTQQKERVVVILNRTEEAVPVTLREKGEGCELVVEGHSIVTICWN